METSDDPPGPGEPSPEEALASAFRERSAIRYDVFISYSTRDTRSAEDLAAALQAKGLACFFAPNDIGRFLYEEAHDQFVRPLADALARSCQCVALVSNAYLDSAWCELELLGAFNLVLHHGGRRGLHVFLLEETGDRLLGQLKGYVRTGTRDELVQAVLEARETCELRVGDSLGHNLPKLFVDLPLRQYYEPPGKAPRAPWGLDSRTPRGHPGAPSYEIYQELVREYMVQMKKLGGPPDPFADQEEARLRLRFPMQNLPQQYDFLAQRAFSDAVRLLRLGVSPTPWRPDLAAIWRDAEGALEQGQDEAGIQRQFGMVQLWEGNWEQAIQHFERAVAMEDPPDPASLAYLAAAYYQRKDYQKAVALLEPISDQRHYLAGKVRAISLARLGRDDEARRERAVVLEIDPAFTTLEERVKSWLVANADLDHWIEGFRMAGFD